MTERGRPAGFGRLEGKEGVIAEAIRRGLSKAELSRQLSVSHQAIDQYCRRVGIKYNRKDAKRKTTRSKTAVGFQCHRCGKQMFRDLASRDLYQFCSVQCHTGRFQKATLDDPREAISMRMQETPWISIGRLYGHPAQVVQKTIYQFLYANGLLTNARLNIIWSPNPTGRRSPSYKWLLDQSSRLLTENAIERFKNDDHRDFVAALLSNHREKADVHR